MQVISWRWGSLVSKCTIRCRRSSVEGIEKTFVSRPLASPTENMAILGPPVTILGLLRSSSSYLLLVSFTREKPLPGRLILKQAGKRAMEMHLSLHHAPRQPVRRRLGSASWKAKHDGRMQRRQQRDLATILLTHRQPLRHREIAGTVRYGESFAYRHADYLGTRKRSEDWCADGKGKQR